MSKVQGRSFKYFPAKTGTKFTNVLSATLLYLILINSESKDVFIAVVGVVVVVVVVVVVSPGARRRVEGH